MRLLVKTNSRANWSGRPGYVALGLCTIALTAMLLGTVVGLMLADLAPEHGRLASSAATREATEAEPAALADLTPTTTPISEPPDRLLAATPEPDATAVSAPTAIPATASIDRPVPSVTHTVGDGQDTPMTGLALQLDPRAVHALSALERNGFMVLAGSFANQDHAATLAQRIAGVATSVTVTRVVAAGGGDSWQVAAGPFTDSATAAAIAADIRRISGINPLIRTTETGE